MDDKTREILRNAGRQDLIDAHEITQSGYAGISKNGNIVDRRKFPDATPIQANKALNVPEPKTL